MRKEIDYIVTDEGRDKGKVFHLTEMPSLQAERLATRAIMAAARAGVEIPSNLGGGVQAIVVMGVQMMMRAHYEDVQPMIDELLTCVTYKPDPANPNVVRKLLPDDVEEVATWLKLRTEVIQLHMGFSIGGSL